MSDDAIRAVDPGGPLGSLSAYAQAFSFVEGPGSSLLSTSTSANAFRSCTEADPLAPDFDRTGSAGYDQQFHTEAGVLTLAPGEEALFQLAASVPAELVPAPARAMPLPASGLLLEAVVEAMGLLARRRGWPREPRPERFLHRHALATP